MSIFEITMLTCFGSAWVASIYKSWTSRQNAGKSILFLFIVLIGYVAGMIHKVKYNHDLVLYLYALNAILVFIDILLYYRNNLLRTRI